MGKSTGTTEPAVDGATPPAEQGPALDELGDGGQKALAAERKARRDAERERNALADRIKSIEDAGKSELERATERAATADRRAADAESEALRYRIAARHGISDAADLDLLGFGDESTLTARAEHLAALRKPSAAGAKPGGQPVESLQQGSGKPDPSEDLDARIAAAQKAGDWRAAIHLQNEKLTMRAG